LPKQREAPSCLPCRVDRSEKLFACSWTPALNPKPRPERDFSFKHGVKQPRFPRLARAATPLDHEKVLNDGVAAGSAVEDVGPGAAEQHVVSCLPAQGVGAGAADQDVVAIAAIGGEPHGGP
jgi:hypothetical protein